MKRISILGVVIAIVIIGWTAAWFYVSGQVRDNIVALAGADGQTTPKLTCGRLDVGGYPFYLDVTCADLAIVSGDVTATIAEVKASVGIDDISHAVAFATGPMTLQDAFTGSKQRLDWKALEASARLTSWRIARISIVGDTLVLNDTQAGDSLIAKASHAEFHLLDIPAQYDAARHLAAVELYSTATDLNAPGLQIDDGKSTLDADIFNLPDDVRTYGDPNLVKNWQAAGGKVKLVGFKGTDGDRNFSVAGNLALDAQARPAGQLTITSKGVVERLGSLVPDQWKPIILGSPAADGSYNEVLNFTNGLAFSGIVPLGAVPPLF